VTRHTKREWLEAWLDGLERTAFTGTVSLTLYLSAGSMDRLDVRERAGKEEETRS
jgi:hypothetical protein